MIQSIQPLTSRSGLQEAFSRTTRSVAITFLMALLGIILLTGCDRPEPLERIVEYEYPLDSLTAGKVFTYREQANDKVIFIKRKKVEENGILYVEEETYNEQILISSAKVSVNARDMRCVAYCEYVQMDTGLVKVPAEMKECKNVRDGKKYRSTHYAWVMSMKKYWRRFSSDEVFEREDTVHVEGAVVDVLVFRTSTRYTLKNRYFPFTTEIEENGFGETYYARNLGVVRFTENGMGDNRLWKLESITNAE